MRVTNRRRQRQQESRLELRADGVHGGAERAGVARGVRRGRGGPGPPAARALLVPHRRQRLDHALVGAHRLQLLAHQLHGAGGPLSTS